MDETYPMESTDVETIPTEPVALATEGADSTIPDESVPETTTQTVPETTVSVIDPVVDSSPEEQESTSATIYLDQSGLEETTEATEEIIIVDVIESVGSDIAHASLFSGFLVSGTLVGIFLLRKIYGT